MFRFKSSNCSLQHLYQSLVEQRYAGGRVDIIHRLAMAWRHKREPSNISCYTKWLQPLSSMLVWNGIGHIRYSLTCLASWTACNHLVSQSIDCHKSILILKPNVDP